MIVIEFIRHTAAVCNETGAMVMSALVADVVDRIAPAHGVNDYHQRRRYDDADGRHENRYQTQLTCLPSCTLRRFSADAIGEYCAE